LSATTTLSYSKFVSNPSYLPHPFLIEAMSDPNEHKDAAEISDTSHGAGESAPGTPEAELKPVRPVNRPPPLWEDDIISQASNNHKRMYLNPRAAVNSDSRPPETESVHHPVSWQNEMLKLHRPANFPVEPRHRSLSELPLRVQEKIKDYGDHLPDETRQEPRFIKMMPGALTVVNGETHIRDDDDRIHWIRVRPRLEQETAAKAVENTISVHKLPTPSMKGSPTCLEESPTLKAPDLNPWRPEATFDESGDHGQNPYFNFPHEHATARAQAVNEGSGYQSVWQQGWRDDLMRAPRYMGFPEKLDELMNFPKCVTDRQDRGQNQEQGTTQAKAVAEPHASNTLEPAMNKYDGRSNTRNSRHDQRVFRCFFRCFL
jgi:hypothetical protein